MDDEFFHIRRNLTPQLRLIGNGSGRVLRHRDPHFLAGLHNNSVGLNGGIGTLVGVYDDILDKARDIDVIPALCQRLHLFPRPGGEGVGTVVCPGPSVRRIPALGYLDHNGYHFVIFCGEDRQG